MHQIAAAPASPAAPSSTAFASIPLAAYAGQVRGAPGEHDYHLMLLAPAITFASWADADAFAKAMGGELPTPEEMPLLAKLQDEMLPGTYWTSERHENGRPASYRLPAGVSFWSRGDSEFIGRVVRRDPVGHAEDWSAPPDQATAALPPATTGAVTAEALLDAELWPADSELLAAIHELFLHTWGMHAGQADARMGRFNYQAARAALEGGAA